MFKKCCSQAAQVFIAGMRMSTRTTWPHKPYSQEIVQLLESQGNKADQEKGQVDQNDCQKVPHTEPRTTTDSGVGGTSFDNSPLLPTSISLSKVKKLTAVEGNRR
jgi:hypothetical protein